MESIGELEEKLSQYKENSLSLDMTRGKPCKEQLDLSNSLLDTKLATYLSADRTDTRNYGGLDGLDEAKKLFAPILGVNEKEVLIGGNASLTLMYQYMDHAFHFGVRGKESAWSKNKDEPVCICPVPGYDRHFSISKHFGIKMINVPLLEDGPDMDMVEEIISKVAGACSMWCVPKFSNPTGTVYSKAVVERIAKLGLKANSNFRVFWDNAYAVHDLEDGIELHNIFDEAKKHGTEDSIVIFGSTSKITLAGSGIGFLGTTETNLKSFKEYLSIQTIGPDKVNQLRHVSFFKNYENILSHMKGHRDILKPKFDLTLKILKEEFEGSNFLSWTVPKGGYFVSVDTLPGLANEVVRMCASLGVKFTPAGSTYPYMKDPEDKNIRIAPSMPSIDSIETAMRVFCKVVKLLSLKKLN